MLERLRLKKPRNIDGVKSLEREIDDYLEEIRKPTVSEIRRKIAEQRQAEKKQVKPDPIKAKVTMPGQIATIEKLTPERSESLLTRVIIDGDEYQNYRLNVHHIMRARLEPIYEVCFGGQERYFSAPFALPNGRAAILGYSLAKEGLKLRSYYLAQPQGLWKYLPDYVKDPAKKSGVSILGRGYGDNSLFLPLGIQKALLQILQEEGVKKVPASNAVFFLLGPAVKYDSLAEYREAMQKNQLKGDYYEEIEDEPVRHKTEVVRVAASAAQKEFLEKNLPASRINAAQKKLPQTLSISPDRSPDFKKLVLQFKTDSDLLGQINCDVFMSKDSQLLWLFCKDKQNRAWVGLVEHLGKISTIGLRQDWTDFGDFMTPLYDYSRQTSGYGDSRDTKGPLQGMWKNYLSQIPLIKEYLRNS